MRLRIGYVLDQLRFVASLGYFRLGSAATFESSSFCALILKNCRPENTVLVPQERE
jgi:hypothetical protein